MKIVTDEEHKLLQKAKRYKESLKQIKAMNRKLTQLLKHSSKKD